MGVRSVLVASLAIAFSGCATPAPDGPARDPGGGATPDPPAAPPTPPPGAVRAEIRAGELLVAGVPFEVRGVTYAPVPAGWNASLGWIHVPEIYETDFPLLRAMGANTVRLVQAPTDVADGGRFLDAAHAHGLKVVLGVPGPMREDAADPAVRNATLAAVREMVEAWKDHPAILMWLVGNEVNYLYGGGDLADWYRLLDEAARLAKRLDPAHPVGTANSGFKDADLFVAHAPSVDVFGVNHYNYKPGDYAWYLAETARRVPGRALLVTEFGVDALDSRTGIEYEAVQAAILVDHLRTVANATNVIGTLLFEWVDEWAKVGRTWEQDRDADWTPWGAHERLPDGAASEEWFGIVRQRAGTHEREPREAYHAIARAWGATAAG